MSHDIRDIDDPRLTAWALGEIDEDDRAAVEAFLAASPEARAAADEIRRLADVLASELSGEDAPALEGRHREAIAAAMAGASDDGAARPEMGGGPAENAERDGSGREDGSVPVGSVHAGREGGSATGSGVATPAGDGEGAPVHSARVLPLFLRSAAAVVVVGLATWAVVRQGPSPEQAASSSPPVARDDGPATPPLGGPDAGDGLGLRSRPETVGDGGERAAGVADVTAGGGPARSEAAPSASDFDTPAASEPRVAAGETRKRAGEMGSLGEGGSAGGRGGAVVDAPAQDSEGRPSPGTVAIGGGGGGAYGRRGKAGPRPVPSGPAATGATVESAPAARTPAPRPGSLAADGATRARVRAEADGKPSHDAALHAPGGTERPDDRFDSTFWPAPPAGREGYAPIHENPFVPLTGDPLSALSTFGADVDTASYANVRRFLNRNEMPPPDAVRIEELINYFTYDDPRPGGEAPFAVSIESATAPWAPRHRLVRVAVQAAAIEATERPATHLTFLLDVSGSMKSNDKLPLLVRSCKLLLDELDEDDRVSIVTYASGSQIVLEPTSCVDRATIEAALDGLRAGGSTHASAGIELAYRVAAQGFLEGGNNRVLLATDGDFNMGVTGNDGLHRLIADKARGGVFLTVLGFGTGNLQDDKAELLADRGNGNYHYIDSLHEAHRVLVEEAGATLVTVAKDLKLQVEFNPSHVAAYRLIGYENRALAATDFRDDTKDAGDVGAGHSVVALYEVVPAGLPGLPGTAELRYQQAPPPPEVLVDSPEMLTVNVRYKRPDEDVGRELAFPYVDGETGFAEASDDFRFTAAVASFGMILRRSAHRGEVDLGDVVDWAESALGDDPGGYRSEFVRLARAAQGLGY